MSVRDNEDLVRRAYAAFGAGDVTTLAEIYAPDVVHVFPGASAVAGTHEGIEAVLTMYGKLAEMAAGTLHIELEDVLSDGGDRVLTIHRASAQRAGQTLEAREALVVTVHDGRITELQDFFGDIARYDAFWS